MAIGLVYTTAHFGYISTSPWYGETAQCGLRMAMVSKIAAPDPGATFTIPSSSSFGQIVEVGSDAAWNWSRTFDAEYVDLDLNANWQLAVANSWLAFWNTHKTMAHTSIRLEAVKIAPILDDGTGKYGAPASVYSLKTPVTGTSAGSMLPPEVAVCASLRAPILGRRGRGRMYLPGWTAAAMTTDGKVGASQRNSVTAETKAMVDALQGNAPLAATQFPLVVVCSNTSTTAVRPAQTRCGDHFDAQRRREHQVPEVYTDLSL